MWILVVALLLPSACSAQASHHSYYYQDYGDDTDFEESYEENVMTIPVLTTTGIEAHTRIRRFQGGNKKTLNPKEIKDIKDVLDDILSNRKGETWAPVLTQTYDHTDHRYIQTDTETQVHNTKLTTRNPGDVDTIKHTTFSITSDRKTTWTSVDWNRINQYLNSDPVFNQVDRMEKLRQLTKNFVSSRKVSMTPVDTTLPSYISSEYFEQSSNLDLKTLDEQEMNKVKETLPYIFNANLTISSSIHASEDIHSTDPYRAISNTSRQPSFTNKTETFPYDVTQTTDVSQYIVQDTSYWLPTSPNLNSSVEALREQKSTTALSSETEVTVTPATTQTTIRLDIQGLLDIIANLTYEYDMNLTERFNETLRKYSLPTCSVPTTTDISTTPSEYNFANTSIVAKCFVCGLDTLEIPRNSFCSDAFAGEFIPLVPVDPRARGQIARYRKYCRYLDVRGYMENPEEPRAMYGRFTGGCSVRWIDLSGIYTQRTCRNRRRAVMGKHFTSKRMAKLEMALNDVDEGCIISPMATLVPLSRGVSLYARFHACVCTGAWCNRTVQNDPWMLNNLILFWYFKFK